MMNITKPELNALAATLRDYIAYERQMLNDSIASADWEKRMRAKAERLMPVIGLLGRCGDSQTAEALRSLVSDFEAEADCFEAFNA